MNEIYSFIFSKFKNQDKYFFEIKNMASDDKKVNIVHYDITEDMKVRAVEFALGHDKNKSGDYEALARALKRDFDNRFHPTWQCVVGHNFGSDIGYYEKNMIYFYIGTTAILLWKAG